VTDDPVKFQPQIFARLGPHRRVALVGNLTPKRANFRLGPDSTSMRICIELACTRAHGYDQYLRNISVGGNRLFWVFQTPIFEPADQSFTTFVAEPVIRGGLQKIGCASPSAFTIFKWTFANVTLLSVLPL